METATKRLVALFIGGHGSAFKLVRYLFPEVPANSPEFDEIRVEFKKIVEDPSFATAVQKARKDTIGTTIQSIKDMAPDYKAEADKLALGLKVEPNVKAGMLKYLLKLGGMEPSQKITLTTVQDYVEKLERDFGEEGEDE